MTKLATRRRDGFTLVELLVVLAILGVLAAVAVPKFVSTNEDSQAAAIQSNLSIMRTAIETYRFQHGGKLPTGNATTFADQLTKKTTKDGTVDSNGGYGPYIDKELPESPLTQTNTVRIVNALGNAPAGNQAWVYATDTGEIRCNSSGTAPDGTPYYEL